MDGSEEEFRFQMLVKQAGRLGTRSDKVLEESCRGQLVGKYMDLKAFDDPLKVLYTFNLEASKTTTKQRVHDSCIVDVEIPAYPTTHKIRLSMHSVTYHRLVTAQSKVSQRERIIRHNPAASDFLYQRQVVPSLPSTTSSNTLGINSRSSQVYYNSSTQSIPTNYDLSGSPTSSPVNMECDSPANSARRSMPLLNGNQKLSNTFPFGVRQSMPDFKATLTQTNMQCRVNSETSLAYQEVNDSLQEYNAN